MRRIAIVVALLLGAVAGAMPARASGMRGAGSTPPSSVFPVPRDPWRSWGVRQELPQRIGPPRVDGRVFVERAPSPVWVPEQWFWDGAAWVWWPGHWAR